MGNQEETEATEKRLNSIYNWKLIETHQEIQFDISGLFYSECEKSDHSLIRFFANDEFIYFFDNGAPKHLSFFLTKMEEVFYYDNGKNVYSLKLTSDKLETVLATTDREIFINFYCHLAKYCILTHFDRHFIVGQKLGSGNYGTVYRGLNKLSNQEVALKVFNKKSIRASHSNKEIVQNQIYILEKLRKHHLSPLLEIFETDDCIILVLELAKYGDLLHYLINQEIQINETFLKHAFCKILQSISALHKAGFIHRDIKPENVVVKRGNQHINLFLCDFSISLIKNDPHCDFLRSFRAGTPGFTAPEILKDNIFNQKCDLFSFGCLIYMLFSGQQLFGSIPDRQIYILLEDNNFIQERISRLPASKSLKKLLRHLLQVNPEKRMSAQEALKSQYFSQNQNETPCIIECDITFKQFIENRINLYSASTKGETSF